MIPTNKQIIETIRSRNDETGFMARDARDEDFQIVEDPSQSEYRVKIPILPAYEQYRYTIVSYAEVWNYIKKNNPDLIY